MSFYVPTKFVWRFGGNQVHLCGSFTRWVETVPMAPVEGQVGTFSVVVHLPPGYHQYKFIVDGEWRHDETQPFMPDPLGNVNNWLFVRKPEKETQGGVAPQQQPASPSPNQQQAQTTIHPSPQQQPSTATRPSSQASPSPSVSMDFNATTAPEQQTAAADTGILAPIAAQAHEPEYSRKKIHEFLTTHTAYELIPESGKVVLLDIDLPVRQAFHALHEQGIASAPIYDSEAGSISGIISASDFIQTLQRLRNIVSNSSNPMSEAEMDQHTIRGLREELAVEGRPPEDLVYVKPTDTLAAVVKTLFENHCSMSPVLLHGHNPGDVDVKDSGDGPDLLHIATISGVLACLMRHFRASLASMPLLSQPLTALPLGTWSPTSSLAHHELSTTANGGVERRDRRRIAPLCTVSPSTPLTEALGLLLEGGISCLPVVDESGLLLDIYARADITMLAKGNAYSRLQFEDVTVGQALALASQPASVQSGFSPGQGAQWLGASPSSSATSMQDLASGANKSRVYVCTTKDTLRTVVERLSVPGVRRLIVVDSETRRVEGIVSLSDLAAYLLI